MEITSPRNPRLKFVRRLQKSVRARRENGSFVAEGVRLAEEALRAGIPARIVLFVDGLNARGMAVVEGYRARGAETWLLSAEAIRSVSATETPQGVLLVLPFPKLPLPQKPDFALILDGVRDPGNMGAILRTAWAAGVQAVFLTGGCVDPFNPKVVRAAMGAHFHLPLRQASPEQIPGMLGGATVYLAAAGEGAPYTKADFRRPLALLIGGEADGVTEAVRRALRPSPVHIPMPGGAESLNAAVAAAVLIYEVLRQRTDGRAYDQNR